MPSMPVGDKRASSGRAPPKHRHSTGNDVVLPKILPGGGGAHTNTGNAHKFWAIHEDSTSPGSEMPRAAGPPRAKKDRGTSGRSNASSTRSSASEATRERLLKAKEWGEVRAVSHSTIFSIFFFGATKPKGHRKRFITELLGRGI